MSRDSTPKIYGLRNSSLSIDGSLPYHNQETSGAGLEPCEFAFKILQEPEEPTQDNRM